MSLKASRHRIDTETNALYAPCFLVCVFHEPSHRGGQALFVHGICQALLTQGRVNFRPSEQFLF
jgi:hypothetical protein